MKKTLFFCSIFILILFSSCYTEVDLDNMDDGSEVVVSAYVANDSLVKVYLLKTMSVNESTQKSYITDATIKLYEDDIEMEDLVLEYSYSSRYSQEKVYYYVSKNTIAKEGRTYRLEIKTIKGVSLTCKTIVPSLVDIISIDTTFNYTYPKENLIKKEENFKIHIKDPVDKNYYRITVTKRVGYNKGNDTIAVSDLVDSDFNNIDSIFSFFGEDKENEFFTSSENNFLIFDDRKINNQEYELELSRTFTESFYGVKKGEFTQYLIELHSLSEDGYNYLKTVDLQNQRNDITKEPVLSYTNITNGSGIFAGYSASQKVITIGEYPVEGCIYK